MGHTILRQFEAGARVLDADSGARLKAALEVAGVIFTAGGVKLRRGPRGGMVGGRATAWPQKPECARTIFVRSRSGRSRSQSLRPPLSAGLYRKRRRVHERRRARREAEGDRRNDQGSGPRALPASRPSPHTRKCSFEMLSNTEASSSRTAVWGCSDDPLDDLSNNHPKQDRDCEEQPFRLHVPRVRFFRLARVRLGFVLLVRHAAILHEASYTSPQTVAGLCRYFPAPEAGNAATGLP